MRQWTDREVMLDWFKQLRAQIPQPFTGVFGPDAVWDAVGEADQRISYRAGRLRVAMPDRYRLDELTGSWRSVLAIAGDGERRQTRYRNRVVTGPAQPLDDDWARLADPAWLLQSDWEVSAAGEADVAGRPGLLLWARHRSGDRMALAADRWAAPSGAITFDRVAVIADPELGVLLRCVGYIGGRAASCTELADLQPRSDAGPAEFSIDVPAGVRTVTSSSPLAQLDLRLPAEAAKAASAIGVAGAAIVSGWLQNRPGRRPPPGGGQSGGDRRDGDHRDGEG